MNGIEKEAENYQVTKRIKNYYKHAREVLHTLHPKFLFAFDREAVERCARRLDICRVTIRTDCETRFARFGVLCLLYEDGMAKSVRNYLIQYLIEKLLKLKLDKVCVGK